jgi:hypothetical protein
MVPRFWYPILHHCGVLFDGRVGISKRTTNRDIPIQCIVFRRISSRGRDIIRYAEYQERLGMEGTIVVAGCTIDASDRVHLVSTG